MKMSTWLFRGVIKMSTFVHEGGRGGQIFEKIGHVVCACPQSNISIANTQCIKKIYYTEKIDSHYNSSTDHLLKPKPN